MRPVPDQTSLRSEQILLEEAQARVSRAVRELSVHMERPAIAIETLVLDSPKPPHFRFAHLYQLIAKRAGYAVVPDIKQRRHGYEHSLVLVRASVPVPYASPAVQELRHVGSSRPVEHARAL